MAKYLDQQCIMATGFKAMAFMIIEIQPLEKLLFLVNMGEMSDDELITHV